MKEKKIVQKDIIHGGDTNYYIPIIVSFLVIHLGLVIERQILPFDIAIGGALVLIVLYVLRFKKKEHKKFIHYLKLFVVLFYSLAILGYNFNYGNNELVLVLNSFLLISSFLLYTTYYVDRIILHTTKKFSIVLNIVLAFVTLFFVVFANIQTNLAKEQTVRADHLAGEAIRLQESAVQEAAKAREAETTTERLQIELQECQESN